MLCGLPCKSASEEAINLVFNMSMKTITNYAFERNLPIPQLCPGNPDVSPATWVFIFLNTNFLSENLRSDAVIEGTPCHILGKDLIPLLLA